MLIRDQLGYLRAVPEQFGWRAPRGTAYGAPAGLGEAQIVYDRLGNPVGAFPLIAALGAKLLPLAAKALPAVTKVLPSLVSKAAPLFQRVLPLAQRIVPQIAQAANLMPGFPTPSAPPPMVAQPRPPTSESPAPVPAPPVAAPMPGPVMTPMAPSPVMVPYPVVPAPMPRPYAVRPPGPFVVPGFPPPYRFRRRARFYPRRPRPAVRRYRVPRGAMPPEGPPIATTAPPPAPPAQPPAPSEAAETSGGVQGWGLAGAGHGGVGFCPRCSRRHS